MHWIDERTVMAQELGAARFLLEHYLAGTANEHVRHETQAWLDRARGAELARSSRTDGTGHSDDCDQQSGDSGPSAFDWLGE